MNIALMSHDHKKELMVQFCTAYCGVLSKHTVCATNTTGRMVAEATGLPVNLFLSHAHGGIEQIGQRIIYNEIDMVLFFNDPRSGELDDSVLSISKLCDQHSVPMATNVATADSPGPPPRGLRTASTAKTAHEYPGHRRTERGPSAERTLRRRPRRRQRHQRARRRARSPCRNTGSKGRVRTPEFGWHHEVFETLSSQSQGTGARFCPPLPFPAGEEVQHQQGPQAEAPEEAFLPASGPR